MLGWESRLHGGGVSEEEASLSLQSGKPDVGRWLCFSRLNRAPGVGGSPTQLEEQACGSLF